MVILYGLSRHLNFMKIRRAQVACRANKVNSNDITSKKNVDESSFTDFTGGDKDILNRGIVFC